MIDKNENLLTEQQLHIEQLHAEIAQLTEKLNGSRALAKRRLAEIRAIERATDPYRIALGRVAKIADAKGYMMIWRVAQIALEGKQ